MAILIAFTAVMLAASITPALASALTCDYGDICVNETGWWRDGGVFNANATTPIQVAVDNADIDETIYVYNSSYEDKLNELLTLQGEGADEVDVTEHTANHNVSDATEALQLAPLNPNFVAYWESPPVTSGDNICGYIPPPMDLSHLDDIPVERLGVLGVTGVLPGSFDWRDSGNVTPVKDQSACGTCWIFGTTSVLESAVLINEGAEYNFSEQSVALCVDRSWVYLYDNSTDPCMGGGWSWLAAEVFIKKGSVLEYCNPYNTTALNCDGSCVCDDCAPVKRVDGYRLVTNDGADLDAIKQAVYDHGPVTMAFFVNLSAFHTVEPWGTIYDYYPCPPLIGAGWHMVSIIGWNDSVPHPDLQHGGTGAWIVKNSWGTGWGNDGYFYLAYKSSCVEEIAYLEHKDPVPDEELLYWDEAGFVYSIGYGDSGAWMASVFTPDHSGNVTHVDFWTTSNNAEYGIYVWDNFFGTELAHQTGICQELGYYSIPLSTPIPMDANQQFTIGVNMTTPGYNYPIPIEYEIEGEVSPTIQSNVSFIRYNSSYSWMDMADVDCNACLRARMVLATFNCTCGDICVNEAGWWRDGGVLNASDTPIQAAVTNATACETICVYNGSYTENVNVNERLTLRGEGVDVVNVTAPTPNSDHVFNVTADYVNISGFNVTGATGDCKAGIYLYGASYCNISDNNCTNNENGIMLEYSSYNIIFANIASSNNNHGIIVLYSNNSNMIFDNTANSNVRSGIALEDSSNNTIANNTASNNQVGIGMWNSSNDNTLSSNTASNNGDIGIYLYESSNNTLTENNISGNSNAGIWMYSSSNNNTFTYNTEANNRWDIYIEDSSSTFTDNTLNGTTVSFTYSGNVLLKGVGSPAADPSGRHSIGKFINATNLTADAWLYLNFCYSTAEVSGLDESSLAVWKYNGTSWLEDIWNGTRYLSTANNVVGVNITTFSVFAPMALAVPTPPATPTPRSSSGGGGGVVSSDEPENVEETVFLRIYLASGSFSTYNFDNIVTSVEVTPEKTYGLVGAKVEVLAGKPGSISTDPPAGVLFKYINVFVGTSGWYEGKFSSSVINFQIPASWFEENNIDPATVTLYRYHDDEWQSLETTLTGQAGGNYQYSSPTPGFSTFMILGQVEESSSGEPAAAIDSGTVAEPTPEATSDKGMPGFGILVGIMGVLVAVYLRQR
jgi:PGF-pre-PGF domain-containing protein